MTMTKAKKAAKAPRPAQPTAAKGKGMTPGMRKAFETSYARHEEALRRLAKL